METANYILQIEALSKSYDKKIFALKDFSYKLESGKICAVVGESGSGKSTLLKLIAGLERSDHGQINMGDQILCNDQIHLNPLCRFVLMKL